MTVVVVRADGHDGDPRMHGGEKRGIGPGRAMVRHLEDVRPEVCSRRQEVVLFLDLRVTRQQHAHSPEPSAQDDRGVVGVRSRRAGDAQRPQHVEPQRPDRECGSRRRHGGHSMVHLAHVRDRTRTGCRISQWRREDAPDGPVVLDSDRAADVIEMVVREDQQRDAPDTEFTETTVHRDRFGTGVDDHGVCPPATLRGREHEAVALADVAGDEQPPRGRPRRDHRPHRNLHDQREDARDRDEPASASSRRAPPHHGRDEDEESRTSPARGPGQRATNDRTEELCVRDQPPTGEAGKLCADNGSRHHKGRQQRRRQSEHGGRRNDRFGKQVRRHRDQTDRAAETDDHRRRHDVCGSGDRQRLCKPRWNSATSQSLRPTRRDQDQGRGREDRQRETQIARQFGMPRQQADHRSGEQRQGAAWTTRRDAGEHDHGHHGGAQHARGGPGEEHETDHE